MKSSDQDPAVFLLQMDKACKKIMEKTNGTMNDFLVDEDSLIIVTKMFEVLGEASVKLQNMGFVVQYPDIPWRDIKDFRNVCAHTYFSINIRQMWEIAKNDVPDVFEKLSKIPELQQALDYINNHLATLKIEQITGTSDTSCHEFLLRQQLKQLIAEAQIETMKYQTWQNLKLSDMVAMILTATEDAQAKARESAKKLWEQRNRQQKKTQNSRDLDL